jgi:hypothetical protein
VNIANNTLSPLNALANKTDDELGAALVKLNGTSVRNYIDLMALNFKTLNDAISCTFLRVGETIKIAERTGGYGGGAEWKVVLRSGVTENESTIINSSGSTLVALQLLETEKLNAKSFGAVSDGIFDSSPAFQAYADYCFDNNLKMHIPAGKYVARTKINLKGSPQVTGDREQTIIEFYDGYLFDITPDAPLAAFCSLRNMTIIKRGASGVGIAVGRGIVTTGFIQGLTIKGVYFQSCNYGMVIHNSRNVIISKCRAIHCDVPLSLRGQNVLTRVTKNDFTAGLGAKVVGIEVLKDSNYESGETKNAENLQVSDNRVYGFNKGIKVEKCLFGSIKDNDFDVIKSIGIEVDLVTDFTVKNNWVAILGGNSSTSICIELKGKNEYSPAHNLVYITNNRMRSYDSTCWSAVHVGNYRESIYVSGNSTITGVTYALWSEPNTRKLFLNGNMFANGAVVIKSDGLTLDSNLINNLNITEASNVQCSNNQGASVTNANLRLTMPAGATSGTLTVQGLPTGANLKFTASDIGGASRGHVYLRSNGTNVITAEVETAIGVETTIPIYVEVYKF